MGNVPGNQVVIATAGSLSKITPKPVRDVFAGRVERGQHACSAKATRERALSIRHRDGREAAASADLHAVAGVSNAMVVFEAKFRRERSA